MGLFFNFGETIDGYDYKVVNERDARASAGIMFLFGLLSLFSVFLLRTIFWAELFSVTFIIEFIVRVVFNTKYAPYMMLGNLIVSNQQPDWVEARPKQFAWFLGLILGAIMTFYILFDKISLIRLAICWLCLFLLFVESVFGICLGCILYRKLNIKVENCPGDVCEIENKPKYDKRKLIYLLLFAIVFVLLYFGLEYWKFENLKEVIIID
ncbi:MAG TPA: DUF4395 domain-containing protein [Crocinitomicaceae bacterium]|nr:DUF4395 domain-containing protein [Crocinitomicaceae bacterium]